MTVSIDKKAGSVTVSGIVVSEAPSIGPDGVETPADPARVGMEYCAQAMEALRNTHTALQLDDAKLDAQVTAKQAECNALKASRPVVIDKGGK